MKRRILTLAAALGRVSKRSALLHWLSTLSANVPTTMKTTRPPESSLDTAYLRQQIGGLSSGLMITFHESTS